MKTSDSPKSPSVVRFITGCSILIRSSALIEVGALDDRYFVYSEDADWCARAQKSGGDLLYVPNSKILHKISSSLSVNSPTYLYYILRNNLLFIRLNVPLRWRWLAWLTISLKSLKEIVKVFARYRHDYRRYLTMIWLAYYHNSKRRYGQL